jgi:hypothetical protein
VNLDRDTHQWTLIFDSNPDCAFVILFIQRTRVDRAPQSA